MKDKKKWVAWLVIFTLLLGMNSGIQPAFASSSAVISSPTILTTAQPYQMITVNVADDTFSYPLKYSIDFGTTGLVAGDISYEERNSDTQFILYLSKKPAAGTIQLTMLAGGLVNQSSSPSNTLSFTVAEPIKEGDFLFYNGDVVGYEGLSEAVVIPDTINGQTVTGIGQRAFDQKFIESVIMPSTVTKIDDFAFQACSLTSIELPAGLQYLGRYALNGNRIESINLPAGITTISDGALANNSFRTLTIPSTVTRIGKEAFRYSHYLQDVTIPESVTYIGEEAFFNCANLKSIIIPASVTSWGINAFSACTRLNAVYFLGDAPSPSVHVFNGSAVGIKFYVLQGKIGYEGSVYEVFDPNLEHNVTFHGNTGDGPVPGILGGKITSKHVVPDNFSSITKTGYRFVGWNTAADGSGTEYLPGDLITIGVADVTLYAQWAQLFSISQDASIANGTLVVTSNGIPVTQAIENERIFVTVVPDSGYRYAERSLSMTLNGVTEEIRNRESEDTFNFSMPAGQVTLNGYFESSAYEFSACTYDGKWTVTAYKGSNSNIIIPSMVNGKKAESIYEFLFFYVNDVKSVTVDEGYTTLSSFMLNETLDLEYIELPDSLTHIDHLAIGNNEKLDRIRIPKSVTSIVVSNFYDCMNLSTLIFEGNAPTLAPVDGGPNFPPGGPNSVIGMDASPIMPLDSDGSFLDRVQSDIKIYHKAGATGFDAAPWNTIPQDIYKYLVKYNHNGAQSGIVPSEVIMVSGSEAIVQGNTGNLVKAGFTFNGWNTKADGSGTHYAVSAQIKESNMSDDILLYAEWKSNTPDNGGGTPPVTPDPTPIPTPTPTPTPSPVPGPVTPPQSSASETVTPVVKVNEQGNAVATVTDKQIEESIAFTEQKDSDQNLIIKVASSGDTNAVETDLSQKSIKALADSGVKGLTLETQIASISFDGAALDTIADGASGNFKISAAKVDTKELSDLAKQEVANRPVYQFSVTSGDKTISEFGGNVTVKLPYSPAKDEDINAIVIYFVKADGTLEMVSNCRYDETTGTIEFVTNHFSMYAVGYHKVTFGDVNENDWCCTAVEFLASREIITGKTENTFKPMDKVTRGEFMTMILRAYGIESDSSLTDNFSDAGNTYYTGYLAVAKKLGITDGIGNNLFAPERAISRQEMSSMLYSAMTALGQPPVSAVTLSLEDFSDVQDIESWAKEAMHALVKFGVLNGNNGHLNPQSLASRAEVAQVLFKVFKR